MRNVYRINSEGVYEDMYIANLGENTYYSGEEWLEIDFNFIETQPPYAKAVKWENGKWIVIEEYPVEPQPPPSIEERLEALELMELERILGGK